MQSIAGKTVLYAPIVLLILQCHVKADVSKPSVSSLLGHQARNDVEMFGLSKQLVAANVTEPTFPELERRQDKDPDVYDCLIKGACLLAALKLQSGPLSTFTDLSSVDGTAWEESDSANLPFPSLDELLQANGWNHNDFKCVAYEYDQPWIDKIGEYTLCVNIEAGVVITPTVESPKKPLIPGAGPNDPPPPDLPYLLSDFMFMILQDMCKNQQSPTACVRNLKWVVHYNVVNKVCLDVAKQATRNPDIYSFPHWPGISFQVAGDYGSTVTQWAKALIGCPNGYGVAYMLSQFRLKFGPRTINNVYVFGNDDASARLCLAYQITSNP